MLNPRILIVSYLVRTLPYGPSPVIGHVFLVAKANKFKINKFGLSAIK